MGIAAIIDVVIMVALIVNCYIIIDANNSNTVLIDDMIVYPPTMVLHVNATIPSQ